MAIPHAGPDPMRVLVVDDEPDTTDLMVMILNGAGFQAIGAYDARQALKIADVMTPRVVLLDRGMPIMDGYELARAVRMLPAMEHALLICISGSGMEEDIQQSREAGCDHHIIKPVDCQELIGMLRTIPRPDN